MHDYKHILTDIERIVDNCVNNATHADELTMQHGAHCTQSVVASSDVSTSHSTWLKPLALVFHSHPIHGHAHCCLSVLFLLTFYFLLYFTFLLFSMSDSMNLKTLCNSANGTFVTLDDCLPDTVFGV